MCFLGPDLFRSESLLLCQLYGAFQFLNILEFDGALERTTDATTSANSKRCHEMRVGSF